jgi:hypothetical protein
VQTAYRCLLLLLPADFRRAFGPAMSTDFATLLRDARRHRSLERCAWRHANTLP